jgi:hypothetical protein
MLDSRTLIVFFGIAIAALGLSCLILGLPSVFRAAKSRGGLSIKKLPISWDGTLCMTVVP